MRDAAMVERIRRKYFVMAPLLDERSRRHWAAAEALELGWGGVTCVAAATGLSRMTITAGMHELSERTADEKLSPRIRRPGAGRPHLVDCDGGLWTALDA